MAGSLSGAKLLSALVVDSFSSISRRGYAAAAAASQGSVTGRSGGAAAARMGKAKEEAEKAWVPDPVTGYYRPANRPTEIDGAELRDLLLNQRIPSHH